MTHSLGVLIFTFRYEYPDNDCMLSRNIKLLTWFNFFTDFKLYAPIAIIYFSNITGSFALGMSVFGITQLSAALFEVPTGIFSDYIGRKKTVILGAIFATFSVIFYALGFNFWFLIVGGVFEGISRAFYSGNNDALLYASLAENQKTEEFHIHLGKLSGMFQVALAVSALFGGLLASYSLSLVLWLSVTPQLICIFIALGLVETKALVKQTSNVYSHLKESIKNFMINPKLRLLSIGDILDYGFGEASFQFRSAFVNSVWPLWAVGIPQMISNILGAVGFFVSGKVINRFGFTKIILKGYILNRVVGILSFAYVTIFSPLLMTITSFFYGINQTSKNTLMQKEFTNKQRATMASLNSLAGSLFFATVAYFMGFVADKLTPGNALLMIQFFMLINIWIYWRLFKYQI